MYKLIYNRITEKIDTIKRTTDNSFIPMDEANMDYREYLKWVEKGNTPEPADQPA